MSSHELLAILNSNIKGIIWAAARGGRPRRLLWPAAALPITKGSVGTLNISQNYAFYTLTFVRHIFNPIL